MVQRHLHVVAGVRWVAEQHSHQPGRLRGPSTTVLGPTTFRTQMFPVEPCSMSSLLNEQFHGVKNRAFSAALRRTNPGMTWPFPPCV